MQLGRTDGRAVRLEKTGIQSEGTPHPPSCPAPPPALTSFTGRRAETKDGLTVPLHDAGHGPPGAAVAQTPTPFSGAGAVPGREDYWEHPA